MFLGLIIFMPLIFATFYVDITEDAKQNILTLEPRFTVHQKDELLRSFFASARHFHPHCRTVILTDRTTTFNSLPGIEIVRLDVDSRLISLSRTLAQQAFLKQNSTTPFPVLFLDYDMLVQGNLESLFHQPFDVALTFRRHPIPINGGFIGIHADGYAGALAFIEKMVAIVHQKPHYYAWHGDQRALIRSIGVHNFFERKSDLIEVDGIRILLLPGDIYNYSTPDDDRGMTGYYPDKKILHFKGSRKIDQSAYFNKHIEH